MSNWISPLEVRRRKALARLPMSETLRLNRGWASVSPRGLMYNGFPRCLMRRRYQVMVGYYVGLLMAEAGMPVWVDRGEIYSTEEHLSAILTLIENSYPERDEL